MTARTGDRPRDDPPSHHTTGGLSAAQLRAGRQQAVRARRLRAAIKAHVRAGELTAMDVIDLAFGDSERGRAAARMTVGDLLLSLPGVGRVTADGWLVDLGINGDRRLRALGPEQRAALARALDGRGTR